MTQSNPPTERQRIGAWCLVALIVTGFIAFVVAAVVQAFR